MSTVFLAYSALVQLFDPHLVAGPRLFNVWTAATVAVAIVGGGALGLRDSYKNAAWPVKNGVLLSMALFAATGLIAVFRIDATGWGPKAGFALLLVYALAHFAVSKLPRGSNTSAARHKREPNVRSGTSSRINNFRGRAGARKSTINATTVVLIVLLAAIALLHLVMNGLMLYAGPRTLTSQTFDHGIFVQAMEGILRTGSPVTTLERGRELSHFAVHFSPVLYLVAPFYAAFRSQVFLNLFQLVPVFLATLPLTAVLRARGLSWNVTGLVAALYLASPAQIFSSHYGFHENVFLGLAIFTLWYFWETRRTVGIVVGALFVLGVKEDAFVYVLAFALWQGFEAYRSGDVKRTRWSTGLGAGALIYFLIVTRLMAVFGEGTMQAQRFANLLADNSGGFGAILNVFLTQPGFVFSQIFLDEKWGYIAIVMAAVAFAPVWNTRFQANWLLLPLVLVNLLSNWPYQYDLGFQYHYGSSAMLLMILVVALPQLDFSWRPLVGAVLAVTVVLTSSYSFIKLSEASSRAVKKLQNHSASADQIKRAISQLPKDSTYLVDSNLGPAMADFSSLYLLDFEIPDGITSGKLDYVVVDQRWQIGDQTSNILRELESQYELHEVVTDAPLLILKNSDARQGE
ncbi:MAG: DUF2079 domain-containing protein [Actinomycetaceae bacterium]|nr:DUF2079 domain-containing protein [Actinomycetaceae bacterium]